MRTNGGADVSRSFTVNRIYYAIRVVEISKHFSPTYISQLLAYKHKKFMKNNEKSTLIAILLVITAALGGVFMYNKQAVDTTQSSEATYVTEVTTSDTSAFLATDDEDTSTVSTDEDTTQSSTVSAQTQSRQSRAS